MDRAARCPVVSISQVSFAVDQVGEANGSGGVRSGGSRARRDAIAFALASVAGLTLLDHKYGCLSVVDDDHRLVGIVTERDYLRFAIKMLQMHDPDGIVPLTHVADRPSRMASRGR